MAPDRMGLGTLEREVMDVFWADVTTDYSVREVAQRFPDHAYTTIMTVLSRLTHKGFLVETRVGRANRFSATASREDYVTSLLLDALSSASDRRAVLARFAESMPAADRNFLRRLFRRTEA